MARRLAWLAAALACALVAVAWSLWPRTPTPERAPRAPERGLEAATGTSPPERVDSEPLPEQPDGLSPIDFERLDREADVHGRVLGAGDRGISGARVKATEQRAPRVFLPAGANVGGPIPVGETTTSSDGSFSIRLRTCAVVTLTADAAGFAPAALDGVQAGARVVIRLGPPLRAEVRVRAVDGTPLSGAQVELLRAKTPAAAGWTRTASTGNDGIADFADLAGPGRVTALVAAEGYVPAVVGGEIGEPGPTTLDVVVERGREVTGRVTDARSGRPVAGACVGTGLPGYPTATTDEDGRYRYRSAPDVAAPSTPATHETPKLGGTDVLSAAAEGYASECVPLPPSMVVDFALEPLCDVVGRVVDSEDRPVSGASVVVAAFDEGAPLATAVSSGAGTSGSDGRFRVRALVPGRVHTLFVSAREYGRLALDFKPTLDAERSFDLGSIRLEPGLAIRGSLTSRNPALSVANVRVRLVGTNLDRDRLDPGRSPPSPVYGRQEQISSDDLGRFRFDDLAAGRYDLDVLVPEGPLIRTRIQLTVPGLSDLQITLEDGPPGKVVDRGDRVAVLTCKVLAIVLGDKVAISAGRNQAVQVGDVFKLTRDGADVGSISVVEVSGEHSIGSVTESGVAAPPQVGDRARRG